MTDWTQSTGSSGTMMIRDTGTTVEFWITSGNSSTFNHDLPWKYTINGSTSAWLQYDYTANAGWKRLGAWTVASDQTVTFYLGDTDTSGFGGPTTFSHFIDRTSVPSAPSIPKLSNITSTSVDATFTDGANNGAAIDARHLGYGTNSTVPVTVIVSDGSTTASGLTPGTTYYFWSRTHNAKGYSAWSGRASAVTLDVPDAPSSIWLSEVTQTTVKAVFTGNSSNGAPVLEWQIGYGTDSTTPQLFVSSTGTSTIAGLSAGRMYYFWARGRNSVGWGPWSVVSSTTLKAGAYLKVGTVWKRAVPYVNVNGVWKVARSWGKVAGSWRETL